MPEFPPTLPDLTPEELALVLAGKRGMNIRQKFAPHPFTGPEYIPDEGPQLPSEPSLLQRILKPFTVSSTATGDALGSMVDRPGDLAAAAKAAVAGGSDAWNDVRENSPSQEFEARTGQPLPFSAKLLLDAAVDPTNAVPVEGAVKLAAAPLLFGTRMLKGAKVGTEAVEDIAKGAKEFDHLGREVGGAERLAEMRQKLDAIFSPDNPQRFINQTGNESIRRIVQGEAGSVNPNLLVPVGTTAAGAVTGAAADRDNPLRGAAIGATVGAGGGLAATKLLDRGVIPLAKAAEETAAAENIAKKVPGLGDVQNAMDTGFYEATETSARTPKPTMAKLEADDEKMFPFLAKHTGLTPEAKKEVADLFFEGDNFWQHRRMGLTWEQANKLADDVSLKIDLPKGTALNQEHTLALRSSAMGLMDNAVNVWKDVEAFENAADPAILAKYGARNALELKSIAQEASLKSTAALQSMAGVRSEAGRALNSYKQLRHAREMGDFDFIQKALEKGAGSEDVYKALNKFGDDPVAKYRYLRDLSKPGAQEYWRWYYITNLLSGPKTQVRNLFGNTSNLAFDLGAAAVRSPLGEGRAQLPGVWAGMKDGYKKAAFMFKNGFSLEQAHDMVEKSPEVFGGRLLPNAIGRSLEAADEFFRTVGFTTELYRSAYAKAAATGVKGDALWELAAKHVTDADPEMVKAAQDYGAKLVFREKPGKIVQATQNLRNKIDQAVPEFVNKYLIDAEKHPVAHGLASVPVGTFVMPFITTPVNILKAGMAMTPVGIAQGVAKGGREGAQMVARAAVGTGLLGFAAMLAAEGKLTGAGPEDPAERDQFWADKIPNAIKIGDHWVSYQQFAPIAFPLSAVANAYEAYRKGNEVSFGEILAKTSNSVLSQSYLAGMMGLIDAISHSETQGDKFVGRTLTGFIPLSGLMRNMRSAVDPAVRNADTVGQNIENSLPGLSKNVPERVDYAGDVPQARGGAVARFISPIEVKSANEDQTRKALVEADSYYTKPPKSLSGVDITKEQSVELQKLYGGVMKDVLTELTQDEAFQSLSVEERKSAIDSVKRDVSRQVRDYFRQQVTGSRQP